MTRPTGNSGQRATELFAVLRERDVLVHHRTTRCHLCRGFISQAATTRRARDQADLYRTSGDSPIVASLIRRRIGQAGRCLVELKARFDELANIGWAKASKRRGARRLRLVGQDPFEDRPRAAARGGWIRRYCHVGTGNYNSKTAPSTRTSGSHVGPRHRADVGDVFNYLTASRDRPTTADPGVAVTVRPRLLEMIAASRSGPQGAS